MTARSKSFVYLFGALGELMFGYDVGVMGVAMIFIAEDFALSPFARGLVVSALLAGATVGVGCAGYLADRFGRRPAVLTMAVTFVAGGVVGALAGSVSMLVVGRILMGLGVGASAVVVPVYLAELAPAEIRGRVGGLGQMMVVSGVLLAYVVDYVLAPWHAWRVMIGLSLVPSALLFIGAFYLPESPRWLAVRPGMAESQLKRVPQNELRLRPVLVCVGLAIFVQLLGVNAIVYYAPQMLMRVGFGTYGATAANLAIGVTNVLGTLWGLAAVDRTGRRFLLLTGSIAMGLIMFALAAAHGMASAEGTALGWMTLAGMAAFLCAFAASWGVCTRLVISELLPQRGRGSAMGGVMVFNWLANFAVGLLFPVVVADFGTGFAFMIFAGLGLLAAVFVTRWVPETKGRSLEQIERSFAAGPASPPSSGDFPVLFHEIE